MKITVNQTLHGYKGGHQLLANSLELGNEEKKLLLFQSDLSGPNSTKGFDEYLTGYPIAKSNAYAFSKTWYAYEMNRPGCVWTHTLIIRFPDLGKLPDLTVLQNYFKRPTIDSYDNYNYPITVEYDEFKSENRTAFTYPELYHFLYDYPEKAIIAASENSEKYQSEILNVWSNQWPRLRRNFYFCTGSLSLRAIGNKSYDLQIVPETIRQLIARNREDILEIEPIYKVWPDWMIVLNEYPKNTIRQFLWTYGSDIPGERSNYPTLIRIFNAVNTRPDLNLISNLLSVSFPQKDQAKLLKSKIFNENTITGVKELDLVKYLCFSDNLTFVDLSALSIEDRLIRLLINDTIDIDEFIEIKSESLPGRLSDNIWEKVELTDSKVFNLIENDPSIFNLFVDKATTIASNPRLWTMSYDLQRRVLESLYYSNKVNNWSPFVNIILETESAAILDLYHLAGSKIIGLSLDWLNQTKTQITFRKDWIKIIFSDNEYVFRKWLYEHQHGLNSRIWVLIFLNLSNRKVQNLDFQHEAWISGYKKLKINSYNLNLPYVACTILAIGFNNKVRNAEWIVAMTFADVYTFAEDERISYDVWGIVPKEVSDDDDDDFGLVETILSIFRIKLKKQHQIPNWDYCEYLIRTLCNKFIQNNWNPQAFIDCLKQPLMFDRAVKYCLTKKKGFNFLLKVHNHIIQEKTVAEKYQTQFLKKIVGYNK